MATDPATWEQLPNDTRDALWKAAQLADAPIPGSVLAGAEDAVGDVLIPAQLAGLAVIAPHPIWGTQVKTQGAARGAIRAGAWTIGGHQLDLLRDLVSTLVGFYFSYFVWPPDEMRRSAALLEPHLDTLAELAKRLELWDELAQLLHRRAIFVSWDGDDARSLERGVRYARDSVIYFRKTEGGKPHKGTLALMQSGLAYLLSRSGQHQKALEAMREAAENVVAQVGSDALEGFLVQCQLAATAQQAGDAETAEHAKQEAKEIAAELAPVGSDRHTALLRQLESGTDPWCLWFLRRYEGL